MSRNNAEVYTALLHYPIYNKNGRIITTTVKNLNIHDISRAGKTYNLSGYYVINHLQSQKELINRMRAYWTGGYGANYNRNRHEAFSILRLADSLNDVLAEIKNETGKEPKIIATDAGEFPNSVTFSEMRNIIFSANHPFVVLLGTGWGLTEETINDCDYILKPIYGRGDFNHLSVRSAASIIMDRLLAPDWWREQENFQNY